MGRRKLVVVIGKLRKGNEFGTKLVDEQAETEWEVEGNPETK